MRRYWRALALALVGLVASVVAYRAFDDWRFRSELDEARRSLAPGAVRRGPVAAGRRWWAAGRATARRCIGSGVCESGLGPARRGARGPGRGCPTGSPFSGRAAVERARRGAAASPAGRGRGR